MVVSKTAHSGFLYKVAVCLDYAMGFRRGTVGNLWRTVVTTCLFFILLYTPFAFFTPLDTDASASLVRSVVLFVAAVLAAIVVWSDTVRWVGDTA